jgi:hypothetical protein
VVEVVLVVEVEVVEEEVVVVVLVGDVAVAPPHGSGSQLPGPMSMPPFFWQARLVFTRHFAAPLPPAWQHWIGSWRPVEAGWAPARRSVPAKTP